MALPFILRFQETCVDIGTLQVNSGTRSHTFTRGEQSDPDPDRPSYEAMKHQPIVAGTGTMTRVQNEQADEDRVFSSYGLMPAESIPLAGTQTSTSVRAESADEDPGERKFRTFPPCSLF